MDPQWNNKEELRLYLISVFSWDSGKLAVLVFQWVGSEFAYTGGFWREILEISQLKAKWSDCVGLITSTSFSNLSFPIEWKNKFVLVLSISLTVYSGAINMLFWNNCLRSSVSTGTTIKISSDWVRLSQTDDNSPVSISLEILEILY